jgi:hypothetical protein
MFHRGKNSISERGRHSSLETGKCSTLAEKSSRMTDIHYKENEYNTCVIYTSTSISSLVLSHTLLSVKRQLRQEGDWTFMD